MANKRQDPLKKLKLCTFYSFCHSFCLLPVFSWVLPHNITSLLTLDVKPLLHQLEAKPCVPAPQQCPNYPLEAHCRSEDVLLRPSRFSFILTRHPKTWNNSMNFLTADFYHKRLSSVVLVFSLLCFSMPSCFIPVEWIPNLGLIDWSIYKWLATAKKRLKELFRQCIKKKNNQWERMKCTGEELWVCKV